VPNEASIDPVFGRPGVCFTCLERAKWLAIRAVEALEWYYRHVEIVFSGKRGFHIHVLDFDPQDWTLQRGKTVTRFDRSSALIVHLGGASQYDSGSCCNGVVD